MNDLSLLDANEFTVVVERLFASPTDPTDDDRRYFRNLRTRIPRTGLLDALQRAGMGLDDAGRERYQRFLEWTAEEVGVFVPKPDANAAAISNGIRDLDASSLFVLMLRMRRVLRRAEQLSEAWQKRPRAAGGDHVTTGEEEAGSPTVVIDSPSPREDESHDDKVGGDNS